jgi:hypothetical protein
MFGAPSDVRGNIWEWEISLSSLAYKSGGSLAPSLPTRAPLFLPNFVSCPTQCPLPLFQASSFVSSRPSYSSLYASRLTHTEHISPTYTGLYLCANLEQHIFPSRIQWGVELPFRRIWLHRNESSNRIPLPYHVCVLSV